MNVRRSLRRVACVAALAASLVVLSIGASAQGRDSRLPQPELRALAALAAREDTPLPVDLGHVHSFEHVFGPVEWQRLSPTEKLLFDRQWHEAVAAAVSLTTPAKARDAGYFQASYFLRGVGSHWINWRLVGRSFDPASPSMLLFDGMPGRPIRLVGFSYWVKADREPEGFAGPNDRWHQHAGLCFDRDGWVTDTDVPDSAACDGYWLNGQDLWMLHAWVVPGWSNQWGRFAPTHPSLCPAWGRGGTPDIMLCQNDSAASKTPLAHHEGRGAVHDGHESGFTASLGPTLRWTGLLAPTILGLFAGSLLVMARIRRKGNLPKQNRETKWLLRRWQTLAAVGLLGTALLHAGLAPDHFSEATIFGVFFSVTGAITAVLAAAVLARPSRRSILAGAVTLLALIGLYVLFRVIPPPGTHSHEELDLVGLVTKTFEGVGIIGCAGMYPHAGNRGRSVRQAATSLQRIVRDATVRSDEAPGSV